MVKAQSEWRKAAVKWLEHNYVERPKGKAALHRGSSSSMNQRLREHLKQEEPGGAPNDKDRPTAANIKALIGYFGKTRRATRIAQEATKWLVTRTDFAGSGNGKLQASVANI